MNLVLPHLPNPQHTFKWVLIGFILQLFLIEILHAHSSVAQSVYGVQINLQIHDASVEEVFELIESKTDFTFSYSREAFDLEKRVSIRGGEQNLGKIIEQLARSVGFEFKQLNHVIMIRKTAERTNHSGWGFIKGRIIDDGTQEVLPGATVVIKGTSTGTTSDLNGEFQLRVPEGVVEIEISYIGFKHGVQVIEVSAGTVTEVICKLISDVTQLADIVVTGTLQGSQRALNQQKSADNIKNVVSADQIGRFPDPNVAEALQRVPAVNVERDQGEGRYVLVRGLAPQFTNISINGEQIPSPEAGVRYVALDAVPADQLASIEVNKSLTPDMDGDAIGGSVNLITRTATSQQWQVSGSLLGGYNNINSQSNAQGSLEVSKRFLSNRLGIMLNSSYYETERGSDNWERDGSELELRDYELTRTRLGLSSTIDFKLNEKSELYFRTIYNKFTDRELRRRDIFVPNVDESPFESNEMEKLTKDRLEKQIVSSYNLGGKHFFTGFNLDYEVSYSEAIQDTPFDVEIGSISEADQLSIDFETDKKYPSFLVNDVPNTSPSNDYLNTSLYEFDEVTFGNTYAKDVNKTAKLNILFPFQVKTNEGSLKVGGKVRFKEKSYSVTENVFGYTGTEDLTLDQYAGGMVDDNFMEGRYLLSANADPEIFIPYFNSNQADFELNVEDKLAAEAVESFTAAEDVWAGYAMAKIKMKKLMLLGGVRYEHTAVNYAYNDVIYDFNGDLQEIIPLTGATDYSFFLPQLHVKYEATSSTNLRLAVTRSYARPNFQDIVPSQEIDLSAREGTIGNPDLKPVSATNLDLLAEHYFGSAGILSGGIFYKGLQDFIFNQRFETDDYPRAEGTTLQLTQAQNGENARLFGFEFAYRQNLSTLPGFLKGFNVYANYTFTSSTAKIQSRTDAGTESIRLPGQAKHVGNFALGYDLGRFDIRVSSNFNGEYITELGEDATEDFYVKDRLQIDATAMYAINNKLRVFAEFLNITNQPFEVYQGSADHYVQREFYSWWTRVGIKFDF